MHQSQLHPEFESLTPMMKQYFELKSQCLGSILFFRMGDFYEIFGEDALEIAPKLELTLTSRERGDKNRIPFCGVPHHSVQGYIQRLIKLNYKIAIADQVEDPKDAKGIVKRDITKVITPGCIDDLQNIDHVHSNFLLALYEGPTSKIISLCLADVSTGEIRIGKIQSWSELKEHVERLRPKEILCRKFCTEDIQKLLISFMEREHLTFSLMPESTLRDDAIQTEILGEVFQDPELLHQPCGPEWSDSKPLVSAVFVYLKQLKISLKSFLSLKPLHEAARFQLSDIAIRDLELFQTTRSLSSKGSLFQEINHTVSPMGARLLRWNMTHPFIDAKEITARHQSVELLLQYERRQNLLTTLRNQMGQLQDFERLLSRVSSGLARPKDLSAILTSMTKFYSLQDIFTKSGFENPLTETLFQNLKALLPVFHHLGSALKTEPGDFGEGHNVFRECFDATLDQKNNLSLHGQELMEEYLEGLRQETRISTLKLKLHQSFGYMIEVTNTHLSKIPETFIRRQTMVGGERFITTKLKEIEESLFSARDEAIIRERELYEQLLQQVAMEFSHFKTLNESFAFFDVLQSLAWLASIKHYEKAELNPSILRLNACKHPVVASVLGEQNFTPNDINLSSDQKTMLITGPNMGGKSTIMRQVAVCAVLNQIGSFVPAKSPLMPIFDQIFTRVGASDDLYQGLSTFMVEMKETATILRQSSKMTLVILDEVGRGTSTEDGLAIASAVLEELATGLTPWALFSTHYHELIPFAQNLKNVCLMQTEVLHQGDMVEFTHRLKEGFASSSFGLEVAALAGIPVQVLTNAQKKLASYKAHQTFNSPQSSVTTSTSQRVNDTLSIISSRLERINIQKTTPLQALNILSECLDSMRNPSASIKPQARLFSEYH